MLQLSPRSFTIKTYLNSIIEIAKHETGTSFFYQNILPIMMEVVLALQILLPLGLSCCGGGSVLLERTRGFSWRVFSNTCLHFNWSPIYD